jgi:hypothetical protein
LPGLGSKPGILIVYFSFLYHWATAAPHFICNCNFWVPIIVDTPPPKKTISRPNRQSRVHYLMSFLRIPATGLHLLIPDDAARSGCRHPRLLDQVLQLPGSRRTGGKLWIPEPEAGSLKNWSRPVTENFSFHLMKMSELTTDFSSCGSGFRFKNRALRPVFLKKLELRRCSKFELI